MELWRIGGSILDNLKSVHTNVLINTLGIL